MTHFFVSDLHFDHANIIQYCDRPFESVDEMNVSLIDSWNSVVTDDDVVLYLGDFGWWDVESIRSFAEQLNGTMALVRGNHDEFGVDDVPFPVLDSYTVSYQGYQFYCSHYPEDVPTGASWWNVHGHVHNNDLEQFPFINPTEKRVNVSCEVLDYKPIDVATLVQLLDAGERVETFDPASLFFE
jgi:calcineurin-like phosphoesterase family protein